MTLLGVILAGGESRRMGGGDKGLLKLGGKTLLARVIARLGPQVAAMAINANGDPGRFAGYGLPVIADSVAGYAGPLAGVLAGLDWAAGEGATHIVTAAADTPFFPEDLATRLVAAAEAAGTSLASAQSVNPRRYVNRHPTFGLWPVALREDLRRALGAGERKIIVWTDRHGCALADFAAEREDPFFNINTPDDMKEAERLIGAAA